MVVTVPLDHVIIILKCLYLRNNLGLGRACRGLTGGFLFLRNFSVAISVSPPVCCILVLIVFSMFLR